MSNANECPQNTLFGSVLCRFQAELGTKLDSTVGNKRGECAEKDGALRDC
jgi:hypothetical protein